MITLKTSLTFDFIERIVYVAMDNIRITVRSIT
jgi:hypothetical protein